ncbi:hypothetical protein BCR39DRAFT_79811 [Naematelia encephala]|uniref:F-box domain-containing protein n=1 Tax=Naematelia encephala TaxID=71784 RepID=A0A1Y2BAR7_9TREE|nr:hypothetical protein BCR39DRAFT_79811 [Naematelia encephala]
MEPPSEEFAPAILAAGHRFANHQHLLDRVVFYADRHTRTVLLRLSKDWFRQVGKLLYETIHVHRDSIESIFAGAELATENTDQVASSTPNFKAALLAQVHCLILSQHKSTQCYHLTSIQRLLPNLEVMTFESQFKSNLDTKRNICDGVTQCRLETGLRPSKIVFRNIIGYEQDFGWLLNMHRRHCELKSVKEYVVCFDRTKIGQIWDNV